MTRNMENEGWSIVLPVKDEVQYLRLSLPSAIRLNPDEIVLVLDEGENLITPVAKEIVERLGYHGLRILYVARNPAWRFHQGYVRRQGYLAAKYDKIFTFDADTILMPKIMFARDLIGKDGVVFVTFQKQLAVRGFFQTLRGKLYKWRGKVELRRRFSVVQAKPFIGIYWVYRPFYLDLMPESLVQTIYNGEDTLAQYLLSLQEKYKQIHLGWIVGCRSLQPENEDEVWRQEQFGIYLGCLSQFVWSGLGRCRSFVMLLLHVFNKLYRHVLRGYFIGRQYPLPLARKIRERGYAEMVMYSKPFGENWIYSYPEKPISSSYLPKHFEAYQKIAEEDTQDAFEKAKWRRHIPLLRFAKIRRDDRVLEVGCGSGEFTQLLYANRGVKAICADLSPIYLRTAKSQGGVEDAVLSVGEYLPFRPFVFNVAVADCILEHLPDPVRLVDGLYAALANNGRMYAVVPWREDVSGYPEIHGVRQHLHSFNNRSLTLLFGHHRSDGASTKLSAPKAFEGGRPNNVREHFYYRILELSRYVFNHLLPNNWLPILLLNEFYVRLRLKSPLFMMIEKVKP